MACPDLVALLTVLSNTQKTMQHQLDHQNRSLSAVQVEINDILHIIEYIDVKVTVMSKITKRMKDLYRIRRTIKEEINILQNVILHKKDPLEELTKSAERNQSYNTQAANALTRLGFVK